MCKKNRKLAKKLKMLLKRNNINHWDKLLYLSTLEEAFAYCKVELSAARYGVLLQKWIITKNKWNKLCPKLLKGDIITKKSSFELKISLGTITCKNFNFVQLRLSHSIDFYILIAYYVNNTNYCALGELFIFKLKKKEILQFVGESYSHGTKFNWSTACTETINRYSEKDIRVLFGSKKWVALLEYRISQSTFSRV